MVYMNEATKTQRHEIEAWLGDTLDDWTKEQVDALVGAADAINERYPDTDPEMRDGEAQRMTALTAAFELIDLAGDTESVTNRVARMGASLRSARQAEVDALTEIRQAALMLVETGGTGVASEQGFARAAGVDRMTVRGWLGKR